MNAIYINLVWRSQRRAAMDEMLAHANVPTYRLEAVDGQSISANERRRLTQHARRGLYAGEVGCVLSHIAAWKRVIAETRSETWILEDDVSLHPKIVPALRRVLDLMHAFDPEWHLLYVKRTSSVDAFYATCSPVHIEPEIDAARPSPDVEVMPGLFVPGPQLGAYSYIVSRSGAATCLKLFQRIVNPLDVQLAMGHATLRQYMWLTDLVQLEMDGISDTRV